MTKSLKLKIEITFELDEEQLQDLFERNDIKFNKNRVNKLKKLMEEVFPDIQEALEEELENQLGEIITEEWEN